MESEAATATREKEPEDFEFLLQLQNPSDPAHVKKYNIMYNVAFTEYTNSIGPCRLPFPKNEQGRLFQGQWYEEHPWLEYSPENDAMYCFSCRLFMNDEKYKSRTGWKSMGVSLRNKGKITGGLSTD